VVWSVAFQHYYSVDLTCKSLATVSYSYHYIIINERKTCFVIPYMRQSNVESQLVSKLCFFQVMEVLYSRLTKAPLTNPDSDIVKTYCRGVPKTGKELTQAITK